MTPVHPIEISGPARRSRDRRPATWRRAPVFQVPGDEPAADAERLASPLPAHSTALVTIEAERSSEVKYASQASHAFVDNVERVVRTPQRVTGWFVDLSV